MATKQQQGDYAYDLQRDGEEIVFRCSENADKWPWLKLRPAHNIAVQAANYFSLTAVSRFTGSLDTEHWSALTEFRWRTFDTSANAKHPSHGKALPAKAKDDPGYSCRFFDRVDAPVYEVSGAGVVFRNRDFEGWREKTKRAVLAMPAPETFTFAEPQAVGVATQGEVFVTPLQEDDAGAYVDALVTAQTGFPPAHPYHGGSGDHVNSSHLCDIAQQASFLLRGPVFPSGGVARFKRYVELERPCRVRMENIDAGIAFTFEQAGECCANLEFQFLE